MILMQIALTNLLLKALNAFSRFHSVVIHLMLPLLLTYLNIRTRWDINQLCHPMHLLSGMLKKLVMPSHFKRTLFCDPTLSSVAPPGFGKQTSPTSLEATGCLVEELPEVEKPVENPVQGDPMDESQCGPHILDNSAKDFDTLADIY